MFRRGSVGLVATEQSLSLSAGNFLGIIVPCYLSTEGVNSCYVDTLFSFLVQSLHCVHR